MLWDLPEINFNQKAEDWQVFHDVAMAGVWEFLSHSVRDGLPSFLPVNSGSAQSTRKDSVWTPCGITSPLVICFALLRRITSASLAFCISTVQISEILFEPAHVMWQVVQTMVPLGTLYCIFDFLLLWGPKSTIE